jgi:hypothetical protein
MWATQLPNMGPRWYNLDRYYLIYSCISTKSYIIVIELVAYTLMFMQEEGVLKGQDLENAVSDADYTKAIQIAFELRRPHKLFELFAELCRLGTSFFSSFFPFSLLSLDFLSESSAGRERLKHI